LSNQNLKLEGRLNNRVQGDICGVGIHLVSEYIVSPHCRDLVHLNLCPCRHYVVVKPKNVANLIFNLLSEVGIL
jgi:hypothetical protein